MEFLPDEIENVIKDYIIFKPNTKDELQEAVDLWCKNKEVVIKFGDISLWDTSLINDMSKLFKSKNKARKQCILLPFKTIKKIVSE